MWSVNKNKQELRLPPSTKKTHLNQCSWFNPDSHFSHFCVIDDGVSKSAITTSSLFSFLLSNLYSECKGN